MRLLIDFGSVKTGGAVQLATNFLRFFDERPADIESIYLLLPEHGPLAKLNDRSRYDGYLTYPNNYLKRKIFEVSTLNAFVKKHGIDTFFTFFGAGIPAPGSIRSIVSLANSNICYPDSPYWKEAPFSVRAKASLFHQLKKHRIRQAHHLLVETGIMAQRIAEHVGVPAERISVIPPSPSLFIADVEYRDSPKHDGRYRFLFLSAIYPHKNLNLLPELAQALVDHGLTNFDFVLSVSKESYIQHYKASCLQHRQIIDAHFTFKGAIPAEEIESVYGIADFSVNLSDLESFSNNYMEAWKFGLPLICGDTDFARHICAESAIYVEPRKPQQAAAVIVEMVRDNARQRAMVDQGKQRLAQLPSLGKRFELVMDRIRAR